MDVGRSQEKQHRQKLFGAGYFSLWRSLVIVAVFLLGSTGICAATTDFFDTTAAQAFRQGKYELAVAEFRRLAEANPQNVLILRYLAISLRQLGQYDESVRMFQYALTLAPKNPALYFHLGVTCYTMQDYETARETFKQAALLAPESEYARLSNEYLDAIERTRRLAEKQRQEPAWGFFLQTGVSCDDNAFASPDDEVDGSEGMGYFSGRRYFLRQREDWLGTAEFSGYLTRHFRSGFSGMNTGIYAGSLALQKTGAWHDLPYLTRFKYGYQHVDVNNDDTYSRSHFVEVSGKLFWQDRYAVELSYRFTYDNFEDDGFDPEFSSRDGNDHIWSLMGSWYTPDGRGSVDFGVEYHHTHPEGDNFTMRGYELVLQSSTPLFWELQGDVSLRYGEDEYPEFTGVHDRETDRWQMTLSLSRWFNKHIYTTFRYSYLDESSNYDFLGYQRNRLDFNMGFSF